MRDSLFAIMHLPLILGDAEELMKVMAVGALAALFGAGCLLGALFHFLSSDPSDRKTAWIFLVLGAVCFAPALFLFIVPEIEHFLHSK